MQAFINAASTLVLDVGAKVLGAIALWVIGKWAIGLITRLSERGLTARKLDGTLTRYVISALGVVLNLLLVIMILSVFGIETTSFAAVFAAAGVAIGMAWSGLLSNFAAGVLMIVLRPFRVGDFIQAAGTMGTVEEIGLFVTTVNTMDNVRTFLGNNAIMSGTIQNFTANPFRRVELTAQLAHGANVAQAMELLKAAVAAIPNAKADPKPDVELLTFNLAGPVLAVRPYCHNDHYWQVYFDTNRTIGETLTAAGFPVPETHIHVQGVGR